MTATVTSIIERAVAKIEKLMLYDEHLGRAPNGWGIYKMVGYRSITVCSGSLQAVLGWLEEREL